MNYIYDGILEQIHAEEIAEEENMTEVEAAKEWFNAVMFEGEGHYDNMPASYRFVAKLDDDWDMYYDYVAEYYFAASDTIGQKKKLKMNEIQSLADYLTTAAMTEFYGQRFLDCEDVHEDADLDKMWEELNEKLYNVINSIN